MGRTDSIVSQIEIESVSPESVVLILNQSSYGGVTLGHRTIAIPGDLCGEQSRVRLASKPASQPYCPLFPVLTSFWLKGPLHPKFSDQSRLTPFAHCTLCHCTYFYFQRPQLMLLI